MSADQLSMLESGERRFERRGQYEARLGLGGVLASLECLWLCHPHAVARAEYKPLQLKALRAYGVAIHANSEAALLDWRRDYASIRYEPFDPPADVLAGMRTYLDAMDLCYGCFDLVATAAGTLTYECDSAGQYLWLEHAIGLPISAGIAALLAKGMV
jgi:hypothetical protein